MLRARAMVAAGLLVVLVAFVYGTETRTGGTFEGGRLDCGPPISASWLVSGTPDVYRADYLTEDEVRRADALCGPLVASDRAAVLGIMGAGALLALVGWTALRGARRVGRPEVRPTTPV